MLDLRPPGIGFKSCVWRTVSSQSSHHPQEVLLAQFSLYVHKGGLKPDSFHFYLWYGDALLVFTGFLIGKGQSLKYGDTCTREIEKQC